MKKTIKKQGVDIVFVDSLSDDNLPEGWCRVLASAENAEGFLKRIEATMASNLKNGVILRHVVKCGDVYEGHFFKEKNKFTN